MEHVWKSDPERRTATFAEMVKRAEEEWGGIDILINNAGILRATRLWPNV